MYNASHTLCKNVNDIARIFYIFLRFGWNFLHKMSTAIYWIVGSFVRISAVMAWFAWGLNEFISILYTFIVWFWQNWVSKKPVHDAVHHSLVLWQLVHWRQYSPYGHKGKYIYAFTIKLLTFWKCSVLCQVCVLCHRVHPLAVLFLFSGAVVASFLFYQWWLNETVECWRNTNRGSLQHLEKSWTQCLLVHPKSHVVCPVGLSPVVHGQKLWQLNT